VETQSLCAKALQLKMGMTVGQAVLDNEVDASQICPSRDSPSPMMQ
jgi:hypothetical protein